MTIYTIYFNTKDFPDEYVVRSWTVESNSLKPVAGPIYWQGNSLEEARESLPVGLTLIPRFVNDDPVILETWM